jgi:hypothetical protein
MVDRHYHPLLIGNLRLWLYGFLLKAIPSRDGYNQVHVRRKHSLSHRPVKTDDPKPDDSIATISANSTERP